MFFLGFYVDDCVWCQLKVVSVILSCGNYMNGGNRQRGQADGFAVDILPKLKDVKSRDNTINLLQYVVRFCITRYELKFCASKHAII